MDKPKSMSVKEYLYKTLAISLNTPSQIIEKVIQHEFESLHDALRTKNSVEISGFGKLLFNTKKAHKELDNWKKVLIRQEGHIKNEALTEARRKSAANKMEITKRTIETLSKKLNVV
jgi:nucleoid DNA-binding protein